MSMKIYSNNPMRSLRPCDDKLMSGGMCQQLEVRLYGYCLFGVPKLRGSGIVNVDEEKYRSDISNIFHSLIGSVF